MSKFLKAMLMVVVILGVYYAVDQYDKKRFADAIQTLNLVSENQLDKLSIIKYPDLQTYQSFDYTEVQDSYRLLNRLDLQETKRFETSENYIKIRFSEDGAQQFIEYLIYDNGNISRAEDAIAVSKYAYYKVDETKLNEIQTTLFAGKTFE